MQFVTDVNHLQIIKNHHDTVTNQQRWHMTVTQSIYLIIVVMALFSDVTSGCDN